MAERIAALDKQRWVCRSGRVTRAPAVVAVAGTTSIGAAAAVLSFAALCDLAARSGVAVPALWPAIVDGVVIVATVAVVAGAGRYAWALLIVGALISVAANVLHAAFPDGVLPVWLCATVAAVPPVALVAVTHLAMRLRDTTPRQVVARDRARPGSDTTPGIDALSQPSAAGNQPDYQDQSDFDDFAPLIAVSVVGKSEVAATLDDDTRTADGGGDDTARARAFELLAAGNSPRAVAEELGVHRATVYRWKRSLLPA